LRNTGVQHPVPQLYCLPNRNEKMITVTAPYAQTVFDGRNVTARPPRTEIWALLYAQVRMADDSDKRNILLADRKLFIPQISNPYIAKLNTNSDATPDGVTGWKNQEVEDLLALYGLPLDSPLSVLCVEMLPGYDNFFANPNYYQAKSSAFVHVNNSLIMDDARLKAELFRNMIQTSNFAINQTRAQKYAYGQHDDNADNIAIVDDNGPRPLTSDLGNYRILRTSLLVAVPEICCTNC
jgi:hypothetical protein